MEYFEQNLERFKTPGIAVASGIGAALVIATMPHVFLENAVGATGLSEIFSAAAPPLGNTARGLIAVVAGLVTAAAVFLFLNRGAQKRVDDNHIQQNNTNREGQDMSLALRKSIIEREQAEMDAEAARMAEAEQKEEKSKFSPSFSMPKFSLKKLLQKPAKKNSGAKQDNRVMDLSDLPKLREADAHPDAPARRPIFAESDLGTPLPAHKEPSVDTVPAPEGFSGNGLTIDELATIPIEEAAIEPTKAARLLENPVYSKDISDMSVGELADRLESGLARLKNLEAAMMPAMAVAQMDHVRSENARANEARAHEAQAHKQGGISVTSETEAAPVEHSAPPLKPVEAPAPTEAEVQATRQADMDAALKAALGTLEKMTAQR